MQKTIFIISWHEEKFYYYLIIHRVHFLQGLWTNGAALFLRVIKWVFLSPSIWTRKWRNWSNSWFGSYLYFSLSPSQSFERRRVLSPESGSSNFLHRLPSVTDPSSSLLASNRIIGSLLMVLLLPSATEIFPVTQGGPYMLSASLPLTLEDRRRGSKPHHSTLHTNFGSIYKLFTIT